MLSSRSGVVKRGWAAERNDGAVVIASGHVRR
jgi:hypothetical protein